MPEIYLFLTTKLSQWAKSPFVIKGVDYNCCEQWMMAEKARLFGDEDSLAEIMAVDKPSPGKGWPDVPRRQKALGRNVKGFDKAKWEEHAQDIVYRGNYAKFMQNPDCWAVLDATGDKIIAEANPRDPIWGIGLSKDDPRALDPEQWQGKNWLGVALMKTRTKIRECTF